MNGKKAQMDILMDIEKKGNKYNTLLSFYILIQI